MARIENQENNTIVYGTDSADDLFNAKINVKIFGYDGNDTIENRGYEVIIEAGDGNDSIYSDVYSEYGDDNYRRATIYGGEGKDTVLVNDNETSLNAGADNDFISIFGNDWWENNTLQGGLGNDTIYGGKSNVIIYEEGDGFDTIFCGTSCDTIQIASNNSYTSIRNGDDIIIRVGNGSMLLKNPSDIIITKASNILNGTENSDKISNDSSYKTISTDSGDDIIYNTGGRGTKLDGSADNDFIYNGGSVENFFNESQKTLEKIQEIIDSTETARAQSIAEAKAYYESVRDNIKNFSDDLAKSLDEIFDFLDDASDKIWTNIKGFKDITDKIDEAAKMYSACRQVVTSTDYGQYSLDRYFWDHMTPAQRQHYTEPQLTDSRYVRHETKWAQVAQTRSSGNSFITNLRDVDRLLETEVAFSFGDAFKKALNGMNLSFIDLGLNIFQSRDEIAKALNETQNVDIFHKWDTFKNILKEQNDGEQYDKLNLSAIDAVATGLEAGIGGLATAALITAGAPALLAGGLIGGIFYVGNAAIKAGYSTSQHSDASWWKTFVSNLNPFNDSTYVQKSLVMSYTLNLAADEISIEIITIIGGTGNDTLLNDRSNNVIIDSGTGDDIIVNQKSENVTIAAGEGNNTITNINSSNVTISGNTGNDFISSNSDSITIDAGDGNNSIINYMGSYISISAGKDNDYIDNIGNDVTIAVGNGNNTVSNIGARASLKTGIGDDEISLIGAAGNINADSGHDLIYNHGNRNTINTGADNDSVNNNDGSNLSIMTGTGQDYIESFGDSNTINSGEDNDVINNIGNLSSVNADLGDDYIENFGDSNTVNSGEGSDYILNVGNKNFISSGTDDDIIEIFGEFNTIIAGAGDDFINLGESSNIIEYTETDGNDIIEGFDITSSLNISGNSYSTQENGSDIIVVVGNSSISLIGAATLSTLHIDGTLAPDTTLDNQKIITLTEGNDTHHNTTSGVSINALGGNDNILNGEINTSSGKDVSIFGEAGDDTIYNHAKNVTINGGVGNDSIHNTADNVTINGGVGSDTIYHRFGRNVLIYGGDGDDSIDNPLDKVTIDGGAGDDTILNTDENVSLVGGEDNDTIINVVVYYGGTLPTYSNHITVNGGKGNDLISLAGNDNKSSMNAIQYTAGDGNDIIYGFNESDTLTITGGSYSSTKSGNDVIVTVGENNITLIGAASLAGININNDTDFPKIIVTDGADNIVNTTSGITITALGSNDTIYNEGANVTINGCDGNDDIDNGSTSTNGGSNVLINGGNGNDTIGSYFADGATMNGEDGDDYLYNHYSNKSELNGGKGNDYLNNWGQNVTLNGGNDDDTVRNGQYVSNVMINGGNGNDLLQNLYGTNVSINGDAGNDSIEIYVSSNVTVNAGRGNDTITIENYDKTVSGGLYEYTNGDDNDVIQGLSSKDTIKISGAKYSSMTSGNDIIITIGTGAITLKDVATLSTVNIINDTTPVNSINVNTYYNDDNSIVTLSPEVKTANASERTKPIRITGNNLANLILGSKGNDTLDGTKGNNTLTGGKGKDIFIYNGGNDIITDYEKGKDKINLDSASISNFTTINKDVTFTLSNNNSLTLNNMADKQISFLSGSKTTKLTFTNNASLDGSEKGATLIPATTEFSAVNYSELVTINAEKVSSAVNIIGNNKANRIIAGNYGSTLNGSKGKDSLIGGNGSDIFIYENKSGNKVIQNYSFGDTISLVGAQLSDASIKGKDVVLKAGSKKITVKGATSQEITISEDGTTKFFVDNILYDEDKTSAILSPKFSAKTEKVFDSTVSYINASKAKKKLILNSDYSGSSTILGGKKNDSLTGNSGNDIIYGGKGNDSLYGSSGNDTLWGEAGKDKLYGGDGNNILIGGKGNDSLWGGNDTDTFIYSKGDGKDIIYGFDDTDILQITDTFSTTYNNSKSEISFKVGSTSNAIMLKNFTATNFNINNDSYQISGSTLVKK